MHKSDAPPLSPNSPLVNGQSPPASPIRTTAFDGVEHAQEVRYDTTWWNGLGISEDIEKQPFEETMIESVVRRVSINSLLGDNADASSNRRNSWQTHARQPSISWTRRGPLLQTDDVRSKPSNMAVAAGVGLTVGLGAGVAGAVVGLLAVGATGAIIGGAAGATLLGSWATVDAAQAEDRESMH